MDKPKIVSSKKILSAELFDAREEKIELPNGSIHVYTNVYRHPTVSIFPLTDKYEIYLIRQYRSLLGRYTLEAVAGFVEENESFLHAAQRELKEETGIVANQWEEFQKLFMAASVVKAETHLFIAKQLEIGISSPEEDEDIIFEKYSLTEALQKIITGEIMTSATIAGILLLNELKRKKRL